MLAASTCAWFSSTYRNKRLVLTQSHTIDAATHCTLTPIHVNILPTNGCRTERSVTLCAMCGCLRLIPCVINSRCTDSHKSKRCKETVKECRNYLFVLCDFYEKRQTGQTVCMNMGPHGDGIQNIIIICFQSKLCTQRARRR